MSCNVTDICDFDIYFTNKKFNFKKIGWKIYVYHELLNSINYWILKQYNY